jgi:predicted peroxiredoxin
MSDKIEPVAWQSMHFGIPVSETHDPAEADKWKQNGGAVRPLYTADALAQARAEALEEAANIAINTGVTIYADKAAFAIRALKEKRDE